MNAIMHILKTGCLWRMLPKDFPPYNTVFYYFSKWKHEGVFEELMDTLHRMVRKLMGGRTPPVSASLIPEASSPPIMLTPIVGSTATRGLKGARNILCLTLGLPMSVVVHEANVHDSVGADGVIDKMKGCFPRLEKMLWRTADTKDGNWPIPYAKSSVRSLPLFSIRTSLRRNSPCCHSDVLWSALSRGWKTFEELPLITSSIRYGRGEGSARLLPTHV